MCVHSFTSKQQQSFLIVCRLNAQQPISKNVFPGLTMEIDQVRDTLVSN